MTKLATIPSPTVKLVRSEPTFYGESLIGDTAHVAAVEEHNNLTVCILDNGERWSAGALINRWRAVEG
jgi:hypothetical protein